MTRTTRALRRLAVLVGLSAMSCCTAGCATVQNLLAIERPTARIVGVGLDGISLSSATLRFDVEVANPYAVPLPLVNLDYDVATSGHPFLAGKAEMQGTVPARGRRTVSLPARLRYVDLIKAARDVKLGSVVPYAASLGMSVDAPGLGTLRLPLRTEGQLPVPAPPGVSLAGVKWDSLSLDQAGGRATLKLTNPNSFALDLATVRYALSLGDQQVAASELASGAALPAGGGSGTVEIPLRFSPRKLGLGALSLITGSGAGYRLTGTLGVKTPFGPMALDFDKTGQAPFHK